MILGMQPAFPLGLQHQTPGFWESQPQATPAAISGAAVSPGAAHGAHGAHGGPAAVAAAGSRTAECRCTARKGVKNSEKIGGFGMLTLKRQRYGDFTKRTALE